MDKMHVRVRACVCAGACILHDHESTYTFEGEIAIYFGLTVKSNAMCSFCPNNETIIIHMYKCSCVCVCLCVSWSDNTVCYLYSIPMYAMKHFYALHTGPWKTKDCAFRFRLCVYFRLHKIQMCVYIKIYVYLTTYINIASHQRLH